MDPRPAVTVWLRTCQKCAFSGDTQIYRIGTSEVKPSNLRFKKLFPPVERADVIQMPAKARQNVVVTGGAHLGGGRMSLGVGVEVEGRRSQVSGGRNGQTGVPCLWDGHSSGWGKSGGGAVLQGKVKGSVCPRHRAEMSQRRQLESKVVGENYTLP